MGGEGKGEGEGLSKGREGGRGILCVCFAVCYCILASHFLSCYNYPFILRSYNFPFNHSLVQSIINFFYILPIILPSILSSNHSFLYSITSFILYFTIFLHCILSYSFLSFSCILFYFFITRHLSPLHSFLSFFFLYFALRFFSLPACSLRMLSFFPVFNLHILTPYLCHSPFPPIRLSTCCIHAGHGTGE